jgi:hypothetical protein
MVDSSFIAGIIYDTSWSKSTIKLTFFKSSYFLRNIYFVCHVRFISFPLEKLLEIIITENGVKKKPTDLLVHIFDVSPVNETGNYLYPFQPLIRKANGENKYFIVTKKLRYKTP